MNNGLRDHMHGIPWPVGLSTYTMRMLNQPRAMTSLAALVKYLINMNYLLDCNHVHKYECQILVWDIPSTQVTILDSCFPLLDSCTCNIVDLLI